IAVRVTQGAKKGAGGRIKSIDVAITHVADQNVVGEGSEGRWGQGQRPGGIQHSLADEPRQQVAVQVISIDKTESRASADAFLRGILLTVGDIEFAPQFADIVGSVSNRKVGIGEGASQAHFVEVTIKYVHRGIEQIG